MIDLHAHYLPAIDDGPTDTEESVAMARLAAEDGIRAAVVTPHHLNGRYITKASTVRVSLSLLTQAVEAAGIDLVLYPGAEVHITPELPDALADGSAMTLADCGRALLVEPPATSLPVGTEAILSECLSQGVTPVIAHPERCRSLQMDLGPLRRFVEMGCLVQLTAQSFTGRFGARAEATASAILAEGNGHVLASDGHRPYGRVPCLSEGRAVVAQRWGEAVADELTDNIPKALLSGDKPSSQRLQRLIAEAEAPPRGRFRSLCERLRGPGQG